MEEKQKKILIIVGIAIALIAAVLVLLLFFWPAPEAPPSPAPEVSAPAPAAPPAPAPKTIDYAHDVYTTQLGDTLWDIAGKSEIYGDPHLWWYLVEPNEEIISYMYQKTDGSWFAYVLPDKKLIIPREKYTPPERITEIQKNLVTYAVEFGTFPAPAEAEPLKAKLRADVYSAYVTSSASGASLRIGFFTNRKIADFVGNEVVEKYPELTGYQVVEPSNPEIKQYRDELRKYFAQKMDL